MNLFKTPLAAALLVLAASTAQGAHLQLQASSTLGSSQTSVSAAPDNLAFNGVIDNLSGLAEVLAFGAGVHHGALPTSGLMINSEWVRQASLDASGAVTHFQATGSTSMGFAGTADLDGVTEAATVGLDASLVVASDGEADGSPVLVRLQLSAQSLFSSSLSGAQDTPTFDLLVQDDSFNTLASYNGLPLNGSDALDLSFNSTVGQTLSFSLLYANTLDVGSASLAGLHQVESSALLDGTLTVTAVPEPQTLALLLAGLGVVATAARRRR